MRIIRRGSGSVVTWRRAKMVLLSAQGMDVPAIAKVAFTSEDRVRDVIRNFNADGFDSLYPRYRGGRPPKFTLPQRREIKKIAKSRPGEHDLPFSAWSLARAGRVPGGRGVVDDISHEGLRVLLREACSLTEAGSGASPQAEREHGQRAQHYQPDHEALQPAEDRRGHHQDREQDDGEDRRLSTDLCSRTIRPHTHNIALLFDI